MHSAADHCPTPTLSGRSTAESGRTTAESGRTTAESGRSSAASLRSTVAALRSTAAALRTTAAALRSTAAAQCRSRTMIRSGVHLWATIPDASGRLASFSVEGRGSRALPRSSWCINVGVGQ